MKHRILSATAAAALAFSLAACDDSTGPEGTTTVFFRAATGGGSASMSPGAVAFSHSDDPDAPTIGAEGTNGRLTIASVHLILSEFELERAEEEADCDDVTDEDACEEFEAPPQFIQLPLSGEDAVAVRQSVPTGLYDELEFEIEDLDLDEDDEDEAEIQDVAAEVREQFPDWPPEGSLRIHGTFMPKDAEGNPLPDQARDFIAFFEAEVEIEKEFATQIEVTEANPSITVVVDPRIWFQRGDGTVIDLSQFDFDPATGEPVPELEVEIEIGVDEAFIEIEFDG